MSMTSQEGLVINYINETYRTASQGFVNKSNQPSMTTPATPFAAEAVVTGSTICLGC